jgi:NAD(P)-dependent dehydrogenase (short-subunit alcohol dehydrogenase family)
VNRIVCVTGASQGVGYETAVAFAAAGDTVIATSRDAATAHPVLAPHGIEVHGLDVAFLASTTARAHDTTPAPRARASGRRGRTSRLR